MTNLWKIFWGNYEQPKNKPFNGGRHGKISQEICGRIVEVNHEILPKKQNHHRTPGDIIGIKCIIFFVESSGIISSEMFGTIPGINLGGKILYTSTEEILGNFRKKILKYSFRNKLKFLRKP